MTDKSILRVWVVGALRELAGSGSVVEVCEIIWRRHEADLRDAGDLFYTWQYDVRWAATKLRAEGTLAPAESGGPWRLT